MNQGKFHKILSLLAAFLLFAQLFMVSIHQFHHKKSSYDLNHSPCSLCMIFHAQNHIIPLSSIDYPKRVIVKEIHEEIVFVKKKKSDLLKQKKLLVRGPPLLSI